MGSEMCIRDSCWVAPWCSQSLESGRYRLPGGDARGQRDADMLSRGPAAEKSLFREFCDGKTWASTSSATSSSSSFSSSGYSGLLCHHSWWSLYISSVIRYILCRDAPSLTRRATAKCLSQSLGRIIYTGLPRTEIRVVLTSRT